VVAAEGLTLLGWRQVPVAPEVVGRFAKATQPRIWQVGTTQQYGLISTRRLQLVWGGVYGVPCTVVLPEQCQLSMRRVLRSSIGC
jgi:hypothetical protein